jgi:hypothetical protein
MAFAACCADLGKWIANPHRKRGLGLTILTAKWGTRFIIEYKNDWSIPAAEDGVQIAFCPFCGTQLDRSSPG